MTRERLKGVYRLREVDRELEDITVHARERAQEADLLRHGLEEIEAVLKIDCAPITWPIGMGKAFRGVFDLRRDRLVRFTPGEERRSDESEAIEGLDNPRLAQLYPAGSPINARDLRIGDVSPSGSPRCSVRRTWWPGWAADRKSVV